MNQTSPSPFVSVAEIAQRLGVSRWMVYERVKSGEIPGQKFGKRILIERAAFDGYLAELPSASEQAS